MEIKHLKRNFIYWYFNEFKVTEEYGQMVLTTENSPWHRERNVGAHTDMVVTNYLSNINGEWTFPQLLGAFAAAFHDVGKPLAEETVYSEERGNYKRYRNHESLSARKWETWAVNNWSLLQEQFYMRPVHIYVIGLLIENHLPWGLRDNQKLDNLSITLLKFGVDDVFLDHLMADNYGRISDDWEDKVATSLTWVDEFEKRNFANSGHPLVSEIYDSSKPVMYVPVAASGSGKTTYFSQDDFSLCEVFSLDKMRLSLYGTDDYSEAYRLSCEDKHFKSVSNEKFRNVLRTQKDVVLDNTNVTTKNRRFYITEARNRGYVIKAYLFPIALSTIIDRQQSRDDKTVPIEAVQHQYNRLRLPKLGEFDDIIIVDNNL